MAFDTERLVVRSAMGVALIGAALMTAACGTTMEAAMTPDEARDALVTTIENTASKLDVGGWNRDRSPEPGNCGERRGELVNFMYGYGAPSPGADFSADVQIVADYWRSLGMDVRVVDAPVYTVYGTGGPVEGLSFSTAPGDYYISGTSLCVEGDADTIL